MKSKFRKNKHEDKADKFPGNEPVRGELSEEQPGHSQVRLVVFEKSGMPRQFQINESVRIAYGRPEGVRDGVLYLDYAFMDVDQAELKACEDGSWTFRDRSDKNNSYLNGVNIDDGREVTLNNRDTIRIVNENGYTFSFVFLFDYRSDVEWKIIPLKKKQNIVHFYSHISEENEVNNAGREDHHALLKTQNKQWTVQDVNTERGVYVNKEKIDGVKILNMFDVVCIGDTLFLCQSGQIAYNNKSFKKNDLAIHIEERSVWNMLKKKTLLSDIDMVIEPGNLVLILGGSGAGKTTFINAVTGYEKANATIADGGVNVYEHFDQLKYEIGFVPQQDLLRGDDTVIGTLVNAAELRMPSYIPAKDRAERVSRVMSMFGLEAVKNSLVEKLSGGQRKRLSIAVEFLADPSLFILDEPDSGLDGVMARELIEQLRKIADQQKIVMVITHTPDRVIDLFDKVIVLAKDSNKVGRLAFYGSIGDARKFFGTDSMEGIVRAINGKDEGGQGRADEFIGRYSRLHDRELRRKSGLFRKGAGTEEDFVETDEEIKTHSGRITQTKIYLGKLLRFFRTQGDWKVIPMSVIISIMIAVVVQGRVFVDMDGTSFGSFAIVCACIWNGMFNSIQVVCRERDIIKREHRSGLHISSYMAAHMLYQALICAVQVIIFIACFKILGLYMPQKGAMTGSFIADFFITLFLITYASDMMSLMISCIVTNTTTAMTVVPFLLIIQIVFSGIAFPLTDPVSKVADITVSKWGTYALCSDSDYNSQPNTVIYSAFNKFRGNEAADLLLDYIDSHVDVRIDLDKWNGEQMQNSDYEYSRENVGLQWAVLALYSVLFAAVGTAVLENIDRDKR